MDMSNASDKVIKEKKIKEVMVIDAMVGFGLKGESVVRI
jgi:NAD(P)H-hydrate repair Nnr-like enzyme with NAD(P)H-hydrate epimerase domain